MDEFSLGEILMIAGVSLIILALISLATINLLQRNKRAEEMSDEVYRLIHGNKESEEE